MHMHRDEETGYHRAMGHLLVLYTQVDQFIMETCAARIAFAPSEKAKFGLAKQVGDESRHVAIQKRWIEQFGVDATPVIGDRALEQLQAHFIELDWVDYLTDLYLVIEALGSQAVEEVVPLADPGTRESLRIPLQDELDHVAFGLAELRDALAVLPPAEREARLRAIPGRIQGMVDRLEDLGLPVLDWFTEVGTNSGELIATLHQRRDELLDRLAA